MPYDNPNDFEDPGFKAWRGGGGQGRGPIGGPGTGPAGQSLGYGSGGTPTGLGAGYVGSGGFSRRRRKPLGGFAGQPPQTMEGAISAIRGGQTAGPMRSGQPVAEGGVPMMPGRAPAPTAGAPAGGGLFGGRVRRMVDQGIRDGRFPNAPGAPPSAGPGVDASDEWNRIMRQFIEQGLLSPEGSMAELDSIRGEVRRTNDAGRERARLRARLSADGDPQALAFANIMSEVQGNRAMSETMGRARASQLDRQQRLGQALYGRGLEQDWGFDSAQQRYDLERAMQQGGQGNWLDQLGGMAGDIGGSFFGGWAGEAGRRLGGGR